MIAFGPVPSRRLGRSLGINNIPPKICTYSCIYCQLGRTISMQVKRAPFYEPREIELICLLKKDGLDLESVQDRWSASSGKTGRPRASTS